MAFCTVASMAQGAKVLNAYNYLQDGEFLKAREEIEPAITNEKTMADAKTWYYRGMIYENIYFSQDPEYASLKKDALMTAVSSFAKALEIGSTRIDMNDLRQRYQRVGAFCYQEGVEQYNNQNFAESFKYFETCYKVKLQENITDSGALYNAAVSAMKSNMYEQAETYFRKSIEVGYNVEDCYVNLAKTYDSRGDKEGYKRILSEARQKLPQSQAIVTAEIDVYLAAKEYDKALANLDIAIKNDPTNPFLYFARGNILDNKQASLTAEGKKEEGSAAYAKAEADYKKALELKPDYFDALYSLGALYYNRGAEMLNEANNILDEAKYKTAKTAAEDQLKAALPYLEKAHSLKPDDVETMTSLKLLYSRTNQMDKYNEINEKLNN